MTPKDFVNWIYPAAERLGEISPLFVTAQAALESGWGKSAIGNNLFGITKGSTWNGPVELVTTTEYFNRPDRSFKAPEKVLSVQNIGNGRYKYKVKRLFRQYDTVDECLQDHLAILRKPGYVDAWPYRHDPDKFVEKIQDAVGLRYATAPNYVDTMKSMFQSVKKYLPL
ncbi:glycoside hydrolase family 73 protein [Parabacteroides leei]|uniref:glycoside hydrolase family 73 protein n=1 Tax=Parabacteroides leei TaxID=2939491 RepID=UPI00189B20F9|nr:glucosaminidase domain-containing protein [Parabacteroides goldsteinii]